MSNSKKTVASLLFVVFFMGTASYIAVPFYNWFCSVTGYGGTPSISLVSSERVLERKIKIRFDGSLDSSLKWQFKPLQHELDLKIGETGLAFYEAYNPTDRAIAGQASYNVVPFSAGSYFNKIDCFCFQEQVLNPGQKVQMPVTFFVDPEIMDDQEAKFVKSITLSYTFYEIDMPEEKVALNSVSPY